MRDLVTFAAYGVLHALSGPAARKALRRFREAAARSTLTVGVVQVQLAPPEQRPEPRIKAGKVEVAR